MYPHIFGVKFTCFGTIDSIAKDCINACKALDTRGVFVFNGVEVHVTKESDWEEVAQSALDAVFSRQKEIYC